MIGELGVLVDDVLEPASDARCDVLRGPDNATSTDPTRFGSKTVPPVRIRVDPGLDLFGQDQESRTADPCTSLRIHHPSGHDHVSAELRVSATDVFGSTVPVDGSARTASTEGVFTDQLEVPLTLARAQPRSCPPGTAPPRARTR